MARGDQPTVVRIGDWFRKEFHVTIEIAVPAQGSQTGAEAQLTGASFEMIANFQGVDFYDDGVPETVQPCHIDGEAQQHPFLPQQFSVEQAGSEFDRHVEPELAVFNGTAGKCTPQSSVPH